MLHGGVPIDLVSNMLHPDHKFCNWLMFDCPKHAKWQPQPWNG